MPINLAESTPLVLEAAPDGGAAKGRYRTLLIKEGWGSSGYYSEAVLRRDGPRCWAAGTQSYLNHPTLTEDVDRPERDVRDYASLIVTDPVWDPVEKGLVAEVQVFPQWRGLLNEEFVKAIGLSIRATGIAEFGEAEGRQGQIITELTEGISVDWVTKAGAGGKVLELIESARSTPVTKTLQEARNVGQWLESRLHLTFTQLTDDMFGNGRLTREERIALSSAIGDGLAAFTTRVEADQPQLYQRDLWDEPSGDAEMVESTPEPKTPDPPMAEPVTETEPGTQPIEEKGAIVPEITEDQAKQLAEAATVKAELEATRTKLAEADKAEADRTAALAESQAQKAAADLELARFRAVEAARPIAATLLTESALPSAAQVRVLGEAVSSVKVPLRDGVLDEPVFRAHIAEAIKAEETYLASLQEGAGAGQPRGLGESKAPEGDVPDAKATESALVEAFKLRGMSPEAAQLAASGRRF